MKKDIAILTVIAAVILGANFPSIFEYKSMYLDDMGRYTLALEDRYNQAVMTRTFLTGHYMFYAGEILERSLVLVRLMTASLMIVTGLIIYLLCRKFLELDRNASTLAAILPNVIPGIDMLPSFLSGSYTIPGQIVAFLGVILAMTFIRGSSRPFLAIAFSAVFYYCSFEFMDQALFLLPAFILLFLHSAQFKFSKRFFVAAALFSAIAAYDLVIYAMSDKPSFAAPVNVELKEMVTRFIKSLSYSLPIPKDSNGASIVMVTIFSALTAIGIITQAVKTFHRPDGFQQSIKGLFPAIFGITLFLSAGFIFWTMSPYFSNRYFHLPAYGTALLVAFCAAATYSLIPRRLRTPIGLVVTTLYVASTAWSKFDLLERKHAKDNFYHEKIESALSAKEYPTNSQFIITGGTSIGTGGYYNYCSGYLKFLTSRNDVSGIFSRPEMQFYDPFRTTERAYVTYMTGIDLKLPVFLYRMHPKTKDLEQVEYALQWEASKWTKGIAGRTGLGGASPEELSNSRWTIYKFDMSSGKSDVLVSGTSLKAYEAYIQTSEFSGDSSSILFAGEMSEATLERFGMGPSL